MVRALSPSLGKTCGRQSGATCVSTEVGPPDIGLPHEDHARRQHLLRLFGECRVDGGILEVGADIRDRIAAPGEALSCRLAASHRMLDEHPVREARGLAKAVERIVGLVEGSRGSRPGSRRRSLARPLRPTDDHDSTSTGRLPCRQSSRVRSAARRACISNKRRQSGVRPAATPASVRPSSGCGDVSREHPFDCLLALQWLSDGNVGQLRLRSLSRKHLRWI